MRRRRLRRRSLRCAAHPRSPSSRYVGSAGFRGDGEAGMLRRGDGSMGGAGAASGFFLSLTSTSSVGRSRTRDRSDRQASPAEEGSSAHLKVATRSCLSSSARPTLAARHDGARRSSAPDASAVAPIDSIRIDSDARDRPCPPRRDVGLLDSGASTPRIHDSHHVDPRDLDHPFHRRSRSISRRAQTARTRLAAETQTARS